MHYAKQPYYSRIRRDSVCNTFQDPIITSVIDAKKITAWGESGFPARFLDLECVAILPAPYHCLPGLIDPPEPAEGHTDDFITIVARNLPPEHCFTCGETARWRYHENPYTLVPPADGGPIVAPPYFCDECAPRDVVLAVLRNSPHNGTGCYDKVHHQP